MKEAVSTMKFTFMLDEVPNEFKILIFASISEKWCLVYKLYSRQLNMLVISSNVSCQKVSVLIPAGLLCRKKDDGCLKELISPLTDLRPIVDISWYY